MFSRFLELETDRLNSLWSMHSWSVRRLLGDLLRHCWMNRTASPVTSSQNSSNVRRQNVILARVVSGSAWSKKGEQPLSLESNLDIILNCIFWLGRYQSSQLTIARRKRQCSKYLCPCSVALRLALQGLVEKNFI